MTLLFVILLYGLQQVNSATITVTNTNDAGAGSLRQAVLDANANPGADIVNFSITGTINLTSGQILVSGELTIDGPGMNQLTINQTTDNRVFVTASGAVLFTVQNLTLNFSGPGTTPYSGGGGAILAGGAGASTTLTNVTIQNFTQQIGNGGAISQSSSLNTHNLTITNCVFTNNKCGGAGGAVSFNSQGGTATITGCTFTNNHTGPVGANTGGDGGAISTTGGGSGGTYLIEKNTFINNRAENTGAHAGAIMNTNGTATVRFNRFIGNTCANTSNPPLANVIGQAGGSSVQVTIADNNWWGVNTGPGTNDATALAVGATMTLTKWLQLKSTASPNPICNTSAGLGNTTTVTASFLSNSAGEAISVSNLSVLLGLPVSWSSTLGSLSSQQTAIQASGTATALFTSNGTGGTATVNAVVDNLTAVETSPSRANITVNTLPTVAPLISTTTCAGSTVTFTSTITGTPAPTIHWRIGTTNLVDGVQASGSTISGAGTATLTITNAQPGDAVSNYNVQASNDCGTATSTNATLIVNIPSVAPTSITGTTIYCNPGSTTLTAEGGTLGTNAHYQWGTGSVIGTSPLVGEISSTLTVSPTTTTTYWVRIENTASPCAANTDGITQVVTVNQPSIAPTSITGNTTTCFGNSTTLTATGGTLGTGANYQWGTGTVVGTSPLPGETNSTLTVSPASNTTYWVRIENTASPCTPMTSGVTQLVTVYQPSVAPTGITGNTTICSGDPTTLTATGGTLGTGAHYQWGTGTIVGTSPLVGETSSSLTVSPSGNTTYWVRIEGTTSPCLANTGGVTQLVTVNQLSVAPTGATGNTTICSGGSTTLTVAGGTKGTGAVTEWFTGSCGGTSAGTGDAITVSPTGTTIYYVRYAGTCNTTTCGMVTVNIAQTNTIQLTSATGTNAQTGCVNTPITTITYATTGATGATISNLPAGVTGNWLANVVTISGSPSASGTFNYTVLLTGGCGNVSENGSITVNQVPTVSAPSVTQPTCALPTGTIVVNASGEGALEYRLNAGEWQTSNSFSGLAAGSYNIFVRLQGNTACATSYSGNPVILNAATGCTVPPTFTLCPVSKTVNTDAGVCTATLSLATLLSYVAATGTPAPTLTVKVGNTTITSSYTFPKGNTTVTVTASNGTLPNATCSFTLTVEDNQPPVINTIAQPIVLLWSPNHKYQNVKASQFVTSVTDNCGSIPVNSVVITKVTSDEPDDIPGKADGNTTQDIKIAANCTSVDLRSERIEGGDGRVYTIYLQVMDSKGNIGTASAKAIVPPSQSGTTAVDNGPAYTVFSNCNIAAALTLNTAAPQRLIQEVQALQVHALPNPTTHQFTIQLTGGSDEGVNLRVVDVLGRVVEARKGIPSNASLQIGSTYRPGIYIVEAVQGSKRVTLKLIKQPD